MIVFSATTNRYFDTEEDFKKWFDEYSFICLRHGFSVEDMKSIFDGLVLQISDDEKGVKKCFSMTKIERVE